jgi:phage host-nuclease inhibitor protein Gam
MQTQTIVDGFIVDPETGEILGHIEQPSEFHVTDCDSADWVLKRMLEAQTAIEAIKANSQRLIKQHERQLEWLKFRFESELEEFAQKELEGQKTKSLILNYGQLRFRTVPPSYKVSEEAIPWLEEKCPEAVKVTKAPLITKVPKPLLDEAYQEGIPGVWLQPERQSFSIVAGGGEK